MRPHPVDDANIANLYPEMYAEYLRQERELADEHHRLHEEKNDNDYNLMADDAEQPIVQPQPIVSPQPVQSRLASFKTDYFFFLKVVSVVFYALLGHDIIMQGFYPDRRYGNTWQNIFGGLPLANPAQFGRAKTNHETWTNHLGSDKVTDYALYWSPTIVAVAAPLLDTPIKLGIRLAQHYRQAADAGSHIIVSRHARIHLALKAFELSALAYSYLRYVELLAQKIKETIYYYEDKSTCENANKIYSYMDKIADYACTLFGDVRDNNIDIRDLYEPQDYLKALLATARKPEIISERLDTLARFSGYRTIDMSKQDWTNWDNEIFLEVFNKLTAMRLNLTTFDMSNRSSLSVEITEKKVAALNNFMQSTPISAFQMQRQQFGFYLGKNFLSGLENLRYKNFNLASTRLGNEAAEAIGRIHVETLNIDDTLLNDGDIALVVANEEHIVDYSFASNMVSDTSINTLVNSKNSDEITRVSLSNGKKITGAGIIQLKKLPALRELQAVNNNLDGNKIAILNDADFPSLRILGISGNDFSDDRAAKQFFETLSGSLEVLDISDTRLKDSSTTYVANYLRHSEVNTLIFSGNDLSVSAFRVLLQGVFESPVTHLNLSRNKLTDQHVNVLMEFLSRYPANLISVNLNDNKITDAGGCKLILALPEASITELQIENNLLTNKSAYAITTSIPQSNLTSLSVSGNPMNGDAVLMIIKAGQLTALYADNIALTYPHVVAIAESLASSPYSLSYLANNELDIDERRALHQATPNQQLETLSLQNSGITPQGEKILFRVLPSTKIALSDLKIDTAEKRNTPIDRSQTWALFTPPTSLAPTYLQTRDALPSTATRRSEAGQSSASIVLEVALILFLLAWLLKLCTNRWRHQSGFYFRRNHASNESSPDSECERKNQFKNNQV
jgi:hypothetical protein